MMIAFTNVIMSTLVAPHVEPAPVELFELSRLDARLVKYALSHF